MFVGEKNKKCPNDLHLFFVDVNLNCVMTCLSACETKIMFPTYEQIPCGFFNVVSGFILTFVNLSSDCPIL